MNSPEQNRDNSDQKPVKFPLYPGEIVCNFKIIDKLGSGGRGDVYLAEDIKLGRQAAIKFLPEWLQNNPDAKRLLIDEAKAASKVTHPNLVAIYAIETLGTCDFIVMQYVKGKTLKYIIEESRLSLEQKIEIIRQISLGLQAAHNSGIVHCDIKPDNIMIDENGQVKILDFGLAHIKGSGIKSPTGEIPGTLAYSSPEQVQNQALDIRSDIFSLGVVAYEILTGSRPFDGEYEAAIIYSIVNEDPPPTGDAIPANIRNIVTKALAKRPDDRYANLAELLADLKNPDALASDQAKSADTADIKNQLLKTATTMLIILLVATAFYIILPGLNLNHKDHKEMVAVLPFENVGPPGDEYLADGTTDAVITELAKSSAIEVISLASSMKYKNSTKSIRQIGHELNADYILTASLTWDKISQPEKIRISPKLIRVENNSYLWAETYEPDPADIFAVQNDIARNVASALKIKLGGDAGESIEAPPTQNMEAYDFYLKGNMYFNRGWEEKDLLNAITMYEQAVSLDPQFALAFAMLSRAHSCLYWDYYDRTESRIALARKAIDTAIRLAPDLPEAKLALGNYYYSRMDYEPALDLFQGVLRSRPSDVEAIAAVAGVYRRTGRLKEAAEFYSRVFLLDPRSNIRAFDIGLTYGMMRDYSKAIEFMDIAIKLSPDWPMSYIYKAWLCLFWKGDIDLSRKVLADASTKTDLEQSEYYWWLLRIVENDYQKAIDKAQLRSDTTSYYLHLARLYRLSGQKQLQCVYCDSAAKILEARLAAQPENARYHSQLGLAYAGLGNKQLAIEHGVEAVSILPPSKEAIYSLFFLANLAEIYVVVGEYDKAIDQLEYSMQIPGFISAPYLKLDPVWQPLRTNPRFQALLTRAAKT